MSDFGSLITQNAIILFIDGEQHIVGTDHMNFEKIRDAVRENRVDDVIDLLDVEEQVDQWVTAADSEFTLENGVLVLDNVPFSFAVTQKVLRMIEAGNQQQPLFNFLRKVRQNPSFTAQEELLLFCEANNFMIHEDGDIIAYKSVRMDYTDIYSGKVSNRIGETPKMPRGSVNDNRDETCSRGLHFASYEYANTWSGRENRLMVIKVNPANVVSIPSDYSNQKGRCCEYTVISELETRNPLPQQEVYTNRDIGFPFYDDCDDCLEGECFCNEDYDEYWDEDENESQSIFF
jgi:hypothetical protein